MAQNLLLEIGLEEMPAHVVTPSMKQLQQKRRSFDSSCTAIQFDRSLFYTSTFSCICDWDSGKSS